MLAAELDPAKFKVHIFERNGQPARKFLVAGDGGLNLSHSEDLDQFILRYTPSRFIENALRHFSNHDLMKWFSDSGMETFIGSSGRIFPKKGIKPIEVLNLFLSKIKKNKAD